MKIILLVPAFFDGLEYQENLLVRYYEKFGHEVHVITSTNRSIFDFVTNRHDGPAAEQTYRLGTATIHRLRHAFNFFHRLYRFPDITPILKDVKPDLIFVHNIMLNMIECIRYVRHHSECKLILDFHGDFINSGANWLSLRVLHGIVFKKIIDQARPYLSRIFPVTPETARFMHEIHGVPHSEMEVLPLGADMDLARHIRASSVRTELRETYHIPPEAIVIFTGGKLVPLRKIEALIGAIKKLSQNKVHLIVVGEAPAKHAGYKQMLVQSAAGATNIQFVGWLGYEDIYRHFAISDIAVFPAGQSILWQQAIGMGLPLVVGDWEDGNQDVTYLNGHDNLIVVPSQSLEAGLLSILQLLIENDALRKKMAAGAEKVAAELLDWNELAYRTLRFNFETQQAPNSNVPNQSSEPV